MGDIDGPILVTGAAGFLGRHLAARFAAAGFTVTGLDNLSSANSTLRCAELDHPNIATIEGSVLDAATTAELVRSHPVVIHLAALVGVEETIRNPEMTARNLVGSLNIVSALTPEHITLFGSSADVYGMHSQIYQRGMHEDDLVLFESGEVSRWLYPRIKGAEENLFHRAPGRHVTIRIFNTYGPGMDFPDARRVVPRFIQDVMTGRPLLLSGNGEQKRALCYYKDTVEGCYRAVDWVRQQGPETKQVFNIGNDEVVSVRELASLIVQLGLKTGLLASPLPVESSALSYSQPFNDSWSRYPSIERARSILGFSPTTSLRDGLEETLRHYTSTVDPGC